MSDEFEHLRSLSDVLASALPVRLLYHMRLSSVKWVDVVGRELALRSQPSMFEYDENDAATLVVSANSPAAAQCVMMNGGAIAQKLKQLYDIDIVSVRATVGG